MEIEQGLKFIDKEQSLGVVFYVLRQRKVGDRYNINIYCVKGKLKIKTIFNEI